MPAIEAFDAAQTAKQLAESVREAGQLALSMFGKPLKHWTKGASSPVSEADIAVDALLHERLGRDPGIAWLSEESVDDPGRLSSSLIWIVDPIDGTRGYIAGLPDWAVSAALVENGRPIAACLFAPVTDEFFVAVSGQGATCNGERMAASSGAEIAGMRIAGPKNFLERLDAIAPPFSIVPRVHSLALRLARVAQGSIDAAIAGGNSHDWDLAAADLLVHQAGGALTPFNGEPLIYNRAVPRHGMLVAAGRDRHAALLQLLNDPHLAPPQSA
ncbi:MAG: inositol monophosphatase family protein [Xanthobacteraceae bacterium]